MGRKIDWAGMTLAFFFVVLFLAVTWGWILNIIKIIHFDESTGMLVVRVIGAFLAPLGAVLGYV